MSFLLALLAAAPPPAIEVTIPNPKKSLPAIERFLDSARHVDDRVAPKTLRIAAEGLVDPFDPAGLEAIGVVTTAPFFLVRPEPRGRHLLVATVRPKQWDEAIAKTKGKDVQTVAGHLVIGAKRRWQTIARREKKTLLAVRATSALGFKNVDPVPLVEREKKTISLLARRRPRRFRRPRGIGPGRDLYVSTRDTSGLTSAVAGFVLKQDRAEFEARIVPDAVQRSLLSDFVTKGGAKQLLQPAEKPPAIEVWANLPRQGRRWLLGQAGAPAALADVVRGPVQIALGADGHLAIAFEATNAKRAKAAVEAVRLRLPKADVGQVGRLVLAQLGGMKRKLETKAKSLPTALRLEVRPNDVFVALRLRSVANDSARIDPTQLAFVRFAYGPVMRVGSRLTLDLERGRHGFVAAGTLFYRNAGNPP